MNRIVPAAPAPESTTTLSDLAAQLAEHRSEDMLGFDSLRTRVRQTESTLHGRLNTIDKTLELQAAHLRRQSECLNAQSATLAQIASRLGVAEVKAEVAEVKAESAQAAAARVESAHDADIAARAATGEKARDALVSLGLAATQQGAKEIAQAKGDRRKIIASILKIVGTLAAGGGLAELARLIHG